MIEGRGKGGKKKKKKNNIVNPLYGREDHRCVGAPEII